MEQDFWRARWEQGQIGFHLEDVNPRLMVHRDVLPAKPARVFMPLCGKSVDLWWLAQQGYDVVGLELSEIAVEAFFRERGLSPRIENEGAFRVYRVSGLTLFCGDFFAMTNAQLGAVDAFYDRAALVALPPPMRERYAAQLTSLLGPDSRGLLICFEYDQTQMSGPPFAVTESEVRVLYGLAFKISRIATYDILEAEPRFRSAGLTALNERVYALQRLL